MKKIIFLHPHFLKPGGASKVVLEFANGLKDACVPNIIITSNVDGAVISNYKALEIINLKWLSTGNIFFWLTFPYFYLKLRKELRKYPDDIILFCHSLAIYWGATYKFFNKKVSTVNYFHDLGMPYTDSRIEISGLPFVSRIIAYITLPIFKYLNYKIVDRADYLISNSQTSANFIEKKYNRKVDLIAYPGVDIDIFKPSPTKEECVYTLGRLEKIKNINLVIKSFSLYCKNYGNKTLKLIIIGDGIEKKSLIKLTENLNIEKQIIFMGSCNQEKSALIASRSKVGIFLCPYESFGLAAVESMACGTPVIGVNRGGIAETVINEQTGLLSDLNENEIANKLNDLLSDKEKLERLSRNARNHVQNNYAWNRSVKILQQFFIKI